ncbi:hypothetical protein LTR36_006938 [Oleoguttula mirabilis]|uniref:Helicase C-terminal domain-containing protein n=1 Tax=Oleoguttula mirabilis TaxID=1507867 RepID=A0AAV9JAV5_9PEZI|nr:hypothetical protein LTR36_006938 [Oleoguttula mirabilis]
MLSQIDPSWRQWEKTRKDFFDRIKTEPYGWESDKTIPILVTIRRILDQGALHAKSLPTEAARKEYLARNNIIIFSGYLAALDILDIGIEEEFDIKSLRLDWQMSIEGRKQVCRQFEEDGKDFRSPSTAPDKSRILLATSKTGMEGLNLVHARHVMFVAPGWNPLDEEQAIGRAVTTGQLGQVLVYRFVMKRSIELRVSDVGAVKRDKVASVQDDLKLAAKLPEMEAWGEADLRSVVRLLSSIVTFTTDHSGNSLRRTQGMVDLRRALQEGMDNLVAIDTRHS